MKNILAHSATVAFTPARAVTSHLRHRYRKHYVPRFSFPRLVFAFDLTILLCTIFLIALQVALFLAMPPRPAPLGLTFTSGPVQSAAPVTLLATVSSRDGRARDSLTLEWQLPENTEIIHADPAIASDNSVYLGRLEPGQTIESRLIVRFYAPVGDTVIGFRVHDIDGYLTGEAKRRIETSAIKLEPLFAGAPALHDGKIPFRVQNSSDLNIEGVTLLNAEPANLGTLLPNQDKIVFALPGSRVSALVRAIPLVEKQAPSIPPASEAVVSLFGVGNKPQLIVLPKNPGTVHVYHPALAHPHTKDFSVSATPTTITLDLDRQINPDEDWYAVFEDGKSWSYVETSKIATAFIVSASARYFASTGDQIGIGPLPPRVGEETKYWIQVKLDPTQSDITDLYAVIALGPGVKPTGRESLPSGGSLTYQTEGFPNLVWRISYLPKSENGAEARFEVSLTPTTDDRGKTMNLVNSIEAVAQEASTRIILESGFGYVDTLLFGDEKAAGRGIVE